MKFRIWFSDGEMRFGWLHDEGSHGRAGDVAEHDKEYAEAQIATELRQGERGLAFVLIPVGASDEEEERLVAECRETARKAQRARWAGR